MTDINLVIPSEEYPVRWKKVQNLMKELNLDIVLAYADDRATFGAAHARWLADIPVHFEPVCILVPAAGDPVLLCGPESDEYCRIRGQVKDIKVLEEFTHPDEDYLYTEIRSLKEIISGLAGLNQNITRIGLAGRGLIGADLLKSFEAAFSSAEWLDIETEMCSLRAVKTKSEIAIIRHAYKIAELGINAALKAIKPGVTEREVAAEIEAAIRKAGAEGTGIDTIVASGPNSRPILARSTFRKIEENDLVLLTVAPRYEGYHAAIGRVVLVGNPGEEIESALSTAVEAQEACYKAIKPGIMGRDVEKIGRDIVEEAGLGEYFLYSGIHSVGVIEFEPPILGPGSDEVLKENMVISVDIPMFNTPWGGIRIEDGYLVTKSGVEKLVSLPCILDLICKER
ncbi:MAG: hypothetical protein DRP58_01005 [Spirochaetes bacterium]|nr:MAG: hypothetical protein DRP58_01005 [Spirochaetota bacterium]